MSRILSEEKASPNMSCDGECGIWAEFLFEPEEALSEAEKDGLAKHLLQCEGCALERELFLESWAALDDAEEELEPCPLLRAKVWQKIREEQCCPKPFFASFVDSTGRSWRSPLLKLAAAAAALVLGFGVGRTLRANPESLGSELAVTGQSLDPALIQLASQEGFSMELFPESTQFSPIDREMMTVLAPSQESREWLSRERGAVVPLQYISQGLPQQGRNVP